MAKTIALVGSLDTKGDEFGFVKELIEAEGIRTLVIDIGVLGDPGITPDITKDEVAEAVGGDLAYLQSGEHKDKAMQVMADGLAVVIQRLFTNGDIDGILGMGGSGNTSIATAGMRTLPVGFPKVMLSTLGGGDISAYTGPKDITFMPSVVDVAGINRISREIYANAAGAITGMVKVSPSESIQPEKPLITASMFGNTTQCVDRARKIMEANGYEVLVFHATGTGGRTMESLIADGYIAGSLDITTTELADEVCGGVLSAGPDRCLAASQAGIPTVLVPGCVDMANFWGLETVPEKYKDRNLYAWNPNVTLMRTNIEENQLIGEMIASAANTSTGLVCVMLPLQGVSMLDSAGDRFWDPDADAACYEAIRTHLASGIPLIEVDANINDPEFAEAVAHKLLEILG